MASTAKDPNELPLGGRAMSQVIINSMSSGHDFVNIAYLLYSKRFRNRKVGRPRPIFANSMVMNCIPNIHQLNGVKLVGKMPAATEEYPYESDSDLDSDSEDECQVNPCNILSTNGSRLLTGSTLSDLAIHIDEAATAGEGASSKAPSEVEIAASECRFHMAIPHVAANTWHALVYYVYTGMVHFSPLRSEGLNSRRQARVARQKKNPLGPPLCSPRSVYRLAKMVGVPSLALLAKNDIEARISTANVIREVFSRFSSTYEDILSMQLEVLYRRGILRDLMPQVLQAVGDAIHGQKSHCVSVLVALLTKLSVLLSEEHPLL